MDSIRIKDHGDYLLLEAPGEITAESSAACKERVDAFFNDKVYAGVVLDIGKLSGINSCGIGLMVTLHTKCVGQDSHFYVLGPSKHVLKTLDLVQLRNFFHIVNTFEEIPGYPRPQEY